MKKRVILSLAVMALVATSTECFGHTLSEVQRHQHSDSRQRYGYYVSGATVYYNGRRVEGASSSSFNSLGGGYGKDSWKVFYRGHKVEGASAMSFVSLGGGYGKDNWNAYYRTHKIEGASSSSFKYVGDGYAEDNWNTYFDGQKIDMSDCHW